MEAFGLLAMLATLSGALVSGAMYKKLAPGAPGGAASGAGGAAANARAEQRQTLERASNAPQQSLLGFFRRSSTYHPELQVQRPAVDVEREAARKKDAASAGWRRLFSLLRTNPRGGRPRAPRQLVSSVVLYHCIGVPGAPDGWWAGKVNLPSREEGTYRFISSEDYQREPRANLVLSVTQGLTGRKWSGYVAAELTKESYQTKWVLLKATAPAATVGKAQPARAS